MADGARAQIQGRPNDLCRSQKLGVTSLLAYQRGQMPRSDLITGSGARERAMDPGGDHSQFSQAVSGIAGNGLRSWFMSPRLRLDIPQSQELNHRFLAPAQRATRFFAMLTLHNHSPKVRNMFFVHSDVD